MVWETSGFSFTITELNDNSFPTEDEIPEIAPLQRTPRLNKKSNRATRYYDEEE